jgi:hypothetical protein
MARRHDADAMQAGQAIASFIANVPTTKPNPFCPSTDAAAVPTAFASSFGILLVRPRRTRLR